MNFDELEAYLRKELHSWEIVVEPDENPDSISYTLKREYKGIHIETYLTISKNVGYTIAHTFPLTNRPENVYQLVNKINKQSLGYFNIMFADDEKDGPTICISKSDYVTPDITEKDIVNNFLVMFNVSTIKEFVELTGISF